MQVLMLPDVMRGEFDNALAAERAADVLYAFGHKVTRWVENRPDPFAGVETVHIVEVDRCPTS